MRQFQADDYCRIIKDDTIIKPENVLIYQPTTLGLELLFQYLHKKYEANICHPIRYYHSEKPIPEYLHFEMFGDIDDIKPYLTEARNKTGDYRLAFIIVNEGHARFMVYIKEGNKEGILYSDSMSTNETYIKEIYKRTGVPVFSHTYGRQADKYSCITDGIVLARDTTGFNQSTEQYRIPNLLGLLEKRVQEELIFQGAYLIRLPHELLKTPQCSLFFNDHKNDKDNSKKIHKDETLEQFRTRYTQEVTISGKKEKEKKISTYLHEKGKKYFEIMQIQFYLNEIEIELGPLPITDRLAFIEGAKAIFKTEKQPSLQHYAETFLKQHQIENQFIKCPEYLIEEQEKYLLSEKIGITELMAQLSDKYIMSFNLLSKLNTILSEHLQDLNDKYDLLGLLRPGEENIFAILRYGYVLTFMSLTDTPLKPGWLYIEPKIDDKKIESIEYKAKHFSDEEVMTGRITQTELEKKMNEWELECYLEALSERKIPWYQPELLFELIGINDQMLMNAPIVLAAIELLLHRSSNSLSPDFWAKVAKVNPIYAEAILTHEQFNNLWENKKLYYYFGQQDAYLAKGVLENYRLFNANEQKALQWTAKYKKYQSDIYSQIEKKQLGNVPKVFFQYSQP